MKVVESGKIIDEWLMLGWFANMWAATNDPLQAKIERLEKANARRKNLNAQMLMNAAESGNRNYLAEIEQLQTKFEELWHDRNLAWDKGYNQGRTSWHQTIVALQNNIKNLSAALYIAAEDAWQSEIVDTLMVNHIEESKEDWIQNKLHEWQGYK